MSVGKVKQQDLILKFFSCENIKIEDKHFIMDDIVF